MDHSVRGTITRSKKTSDYEYKSSPADRRPSKRKDKVAEQSSLVM